MSRWPSASPSTPSPRCSSPLFQHRYMTRYVSGILMSQLWWANHTDAMRWFRDAFIGAAPPRFSHLEVGPGHGLYLALAASSPRCIRSRAALLAGDPGRHVRRAWHDRCCHRAQARRCVDHRQLVAVLPGSRARGLGNAHEPPRCGGVPCGIPQILGEYIATARNAMTSDFYPRPGFRERASPAVDGRKIVVLDTETSEPRRSFIEVVRPGMSNQAPS